MKPFTKNILIFLLVIAFVLFFLRLTSPREIDDVNPLRNCEQEYLNKSQILWVIPLYENISIAENKTWCQEILALNKTLGMHGILHTYHEFNSSIDESELQKAMSEFQKCFNQKPTIFKAPNLALSKENKIILEKYFLDIRNPFDQTIHKVYHCSDSGTFPNWIHDLV